MTSYSGLANYEHASSAKLGVLLVNLGTPKAPTRAAVRQFLAEFLGDPRVVESPRWLWLPILHGVILQIRPSRSAHAYQQIWTQEGSPLLHHCQQLAAQMREQLNKQLQPQESERICVEIGMTYGEPSIASGLRKLQAAGMQRLIVLPLYPQYSGTSTGSVFDRVSAELQHWRWVPELRFINHYHDQPSYIEALAASIEAHRTKQQAQATHARHHLLFSFHGLPRRCLLEGDPYYCQCSKTARLVAERLDLQPDEWSMAFQSRVGREEWLRPYTDQLLIQYAASDRKRVTMVCPGFAVDNLETLEEIAIRNRDLFLQHGGESYDYVPALNVTAPHVALLCELVNGQLQGQPVPPGGAAHAANDTKRRAMLAGAAR